MMPGGFTMIQAIVHRFLHRRVFGVQIHNGNEGQKVFYAVEGAIQGLGNRVLKDNSLLIVQVVVKVGLQRSGCWLAALPV